MRPISAKNRKGIDTDPYYKKCFRHKEGTCKGRVTIEHAWIYAGRQIDELWALIPVCAYHHEVDEFQDCGDLDKDKNQLEALRRATPDDLAKYPKKDWQKEKIWLERKTQSVTKNSKSEKTSYSL